MESLTPSVGRFIKLTGKRISQGNKNFLTERMMFLLQKVLSDIIIGDVLRTSPLVRITSEDLKMLHKKIPFLSGGAIRMPGEYFGYDSGRYTSDGSGVDTATVNFSENIARAGLETTTFTGGMANIISKKALQDLLRENQVKMSASVFAEFNAWIHHLVRLLNHKIQEKCKGDELTYRQIEVVFDSVIRKLNKK